MTPDLLLPAALLVLSVILTGVATTTLAWMLYAWRAGDSPATTAFTAQPAEPGGLSFSLLVPARHETAVLMHTLESMAALRHPRVEVLAIVGHDDPQTAAVANTAAQRWPDRVRVVVDHHPEKNKPKALNTALPHCTGDVVGVFDAEDAVHPDLLTAVEAQFARDEADAVQAGVQLINHWSSWYAVRNCLEYYFWFRSRLHFHADRRFIPLGGNTVFVRRPALLDLDGWDSDCLAEDCDLGVRLSAAGKRISVAYDPALATREEVPDTLNGFVKQRTRWSQGFLQVLRKGDWKRLSTRRQRALARYTLAMPFLQAVSGVLIPLSVLTAVYAHVPIAVALLTFVPLLPTLATVVVEWVGLHDFARSYGNTVRVRDVVRLVVGAAPYQVLLAFAAVRAAAREATGRRGWAKTAHLGLHLGAGVGERAPASVG